MITDTRDEAIQLFIKSCKAMLPFCNCLFVDILYNDQIVESHQLITVNGVKRLIEDNPKSTFRLTNTLVLDYTFVDELHN